MLTVRNEILIVINIVVIHYSKTIKAVCKRFRALYSCESNHHKNCEILKNPPIYHQTTEYYHAQNSPVKG